MKKLLAILMMIVLTLSLSACMENTPAPKESDLESENVEISSDIEDVSDTTETTESSDEAETHVHSFADATCTAPKTCGACKATEGFGT